MRMGPNFITPTEFISVGTNAFEQSGKSPKVVAPFLLQTLVAI